MVLPLFLMAGGAAKEYKAKLRAESEAQARWGLYKKQGQMLIII